MDSNRTQAMKTIALYLLDPKCSVQSGNGIIHALEQDFRFKIFSKNPLEADFFDDVDIVAVPGGFGDANAYTQAFKHNESRVREFVQQGGAYLGICMGAYWAGRDYLNILDSIDAVQYIKQPQTDTRRPHAKDLTVMWNNTPTKMFFYDGCALIGNLAGSNTRTVATYSNGDAMAVQQGRIGLIGCHPEAEPFWYDSYSYLRGRYTNNHAALREFVSQL
jgi:glutamine amidotransferase-like uncharacterized protein